MVNLLRCVEVANVCVAVLDVTDTTILEHVFVMLAVETEVDMDAIRISLTAPTSTSWLTTGSPDLRKRITSLGLPMGPCESTIHVRLWPPGTVRRDLDLFVRDVAPAASHGRRSHSRSKAGRAHVHHQSSSSAAPAIGNSADQRTAKLIEEMEKAVRQREIDNNLLTAMEYTPEAFTRFTMLYVDCEINHHPVKAFVDSGAHRSFMNVVTAKRCGIMRLLDTRMKSVVNGMGQQVILGRIHFVTVNLAGLFIPFSFDVVEDLRYDMMFGLDQLRRHLMQIDLKHDCLLFEDIEVPFLPESQLPAIEKPFVEAPKQDNGATKRRAEPCAAQRKARDTAAPATGKSAGSRPCTAKLTEEMKKAVRQREIDNNLLTAMEYTPEAFTHLTMLHVDCEVNHHPVKAYVDSGAEISIMNVATAERCGIMRLLDTRMKTVAIGIGERIILGRIHFVTVNLAGMFIPFSFSVMEYQDIDIIIGLDQMRRHLMQIDLKHNCLRIEDIEVPFLPESQLPEKAKPHMKARCALEALNQDNEATKRRPEQRAALDQLTTLTGGVYPRAALIAVLEAAGWNVETAATLLFEES